MFDATPPAYHAQMPERFIRPAPDYCITKEPIPFWVKPASLPEELSDCPDVLEDCQFDCESKSIYSHIARKIEHQIDAVHFGSVEIPFTPNYQKLILHSCEIIRNGNRLDRLEDAQIYVIQDQWDGWIFTDTLKALIFLDDVSEGDLLEYSYTIVGFPFDRWGFRLPLQSKTELQKLHLRIVKPKESAFNSTLYNPPEGLAIQETETEYQVTQEPCPAKKTEANQPASFYDTPSIQFTEATSWNDVVQDKLQFYQLDPSFDFNPEALDLIRDWEKNSLSKEEAALKALRFVQDEIRYLALALGDGGFNPANPNETLKRRYGDCKAKTQLLRAFLHLLDIPSTPVLVHIKKLDGIDHFLPQQIFNHVIVRIDLAEEPIYVDPTMLYQGGSLKESYLPYRKGLALSEETQELSTIPELRAEIDLDRTTTFTIGESVTMTINSNYYGEFANWFRHEISQRGKKACAKDLKDLYEDFYGSIKLVSYDYEDDRALNKIQASITLKLKDPWTQDSEEENYFCYRAKPLAYFQQEFDPEKRKSPLQLPPLYRIKERVLLSSGGIECIPVQIEHPAFDFTAHSPSEQEVVFELNGKLDSLEPEDLEEYAEELIFGRYSSIALIYEHPRDARWALQVARILAKP